METDRNRLGVTQRIDDDDYARLGAVLEARFPDNALELQSISASFAAAGHYVSYQYLAAWAYYHELAVSVRPGTCAHSTTPQQRRAHAMPCRSRAMRPPALPLSLLVLVL